MSSSSRVVGLTVACLIADKCIFSVCKSWDTGSRVGTLFKLARRPIWNSFVVVLICSHVVMMFKASYVSVSQPVKRFSKFALTDSNSRTCHGLVWYQILCSLCTVVNPPFKPVRRALRRTFNEHWSTGCCMLFFIFWSSGDTQHEIQLISPIRL